MKFKRILIAGGAGFIGTNIAKLALEKNYQVIIFDNFFRKGVEDNAAYLKTLGAKIIKGDVRQPKELKTLPKIDAIINLAANSGVPLSIKKPLFDFKVNALGALNVLELARQRGKIPVIFASTNKVYSDAVNELTTKEEKTRYVWQNKNLKGIKEDFPMDGCGKNPHSPYGCSKAAADLYHQEYFHIYQVPTIINRMSCIYGFFQKGAEEQGWLYWFIKAKIKNHVLNIYGNGKQVRDVLFGSDLAKLYLEQLENIKKHQGQVYNIGGGMNNSVSLIEIIDYLNKKGGQKLKLKFLDWRPADHKIYISDITKITNQSSWQPTTSVWQGIDKVWQSLL